MKQRGFTLPEMLIVFWFLLCTAGLVGWVMNVWKLCSMGFDHLTGMMVARGIGVFVAPMGAVLGFF